MEFDRYKAFPEWQQRRSMTMDEFKHIFFWEVRINGLVCSYISCLHGRREEGADCHADGQLLRFFVSRLPSDTPSWWVCHQTWKLTQFLSFCSGLYQSRLPPLPSPLRPPYQLNKFNTTLLLVVDVIYLSSRLRSCSTPTACWGVR